MLRRLRPFHRDQRGVSAVEFAFIAPVLVIIYMGLVELCQALMAERRSSHATSSVADLITQDQTITTTELQDVFTIADSIMAPMNTASLKMCAGSISSNATTGALSVDWSQNSAGGAPSVTCSSVPADFPTQQVNGATKPFINPGESVVISRAEYTYTSMMTNSTLFKAPVVFKEVFYLRPRKSNTVTCTVGSTPTLCGKQ